MRRKKLSKASAEQWHVDFRIPANLPDIKIVRTDFVIVCVCMLAPVILAGLLAYNYLRIENARDRIVALQEQVAQKQGADREMVAMSRLFEDEAVRIGEVTAFLQQDYDPVAVLVRLVRLRPGNIAYQNISIVELEERAKTEKAPGEAPGVRVRINGMLRGNSAEHLEQIEAFQQQIGEDDYFRDQEIDMQLVVQRNTVADVFDFNLLITIRGKK